MQDKSFESQEIRGSKILIVDSHNNYGIILRQKRTLIAKTKDNEIDGNRRWTHSRWGKSMVIVVCHMM